MAGIEVRLESLRLLAAQHQHTSATFIELAAFEPAADAPAETAAALERLATRARANLWELARCHREMCTLIQKASDRYVDLERP